MQRFHPSPGVVGALVPCQHVELWLMPLRQAGLSCLHFARLFSRSVDCFSSAWRRPNSKGLQRRGRERGCRPRGQLGQDVSSGSRTNSESWAGCFELPEKNRGMTGPPWPSDCLSTDGMSLYHRQVTSFPLCDVHDPRLGHILGQSDLEVYTPLSLPPL